MAKHKTATRAARRDGGRRAKNPKPGRTAARRGRTPKSSARAIAKKATARAGRTAKTPAKASAARVGAMGRRQRAPREPEDVTAQVQRRWDLEAEKVPTPPSSLDLDRRASAARTGRREMVARRSKHTAASPAITAGDVDADWEGAYFAGDEAAAGDNPTPDQAAVEEVGRAVGVNYEDTEELKSTPKIDKRDKKRWELDPASSEDFKDRTRGPKPRPLKA